MFHFLLYDNQGLTHLKHSEKMSLVRQATKAYRQAHPINLPKRLLLIAFFCLLPAIALYFLLSLTAGLAWLCLSVTLVNIKLANDESDDIKPYLEKAIKQQL